MCMNEGIRSSSDTTGKKEYSDIKKKFLYGYCDAHRVPEKEWQDGHI